MFNTPFILTFSLCLSLPILFLLAPSLLLPTPSSAPPISPLDERDDLLLFRRASSSSSSLSRLSTPNPTLKIAFLFLTNTDLYFSPLWDKFFRSHPNSRNLYNVYVHADPSRNVSDPVGALHGRFIPHAKRTFRASPTLVSATRRLIATALLDDPANAYFIVLSQYCVPLHSFKYVYDSLIFSRSFDRSSDSDPDSTRLGVRVRFKSFIEIVSQEPRLWKRYVARGRYSMLPEVPFEKFRVGSQFFSLTRRHALMVVRDERFWKKFKLPCYRDDECYPEEHYFPTLLSMLDPEGLTRYALTRVNWTGTTNGHPYTYRPNKVSAALIRQLRRSNYSSSYLFARKFSPDCLKPMMKLADKFIFRD